MEAQMHGGSIETKSAASIETSPAKIQSELGSCDRLSKELPISEVGSSVRDRVASQVRRSVWSAPPRSASSNELRDMIERQDFKCALSGRTLTPDTAALDHKVPVANGGTNDAANLQWLHDEVNKAKGTMPLDAFVRLCCEVADYSRGVSD